jgi:hypothetical protein
MPPVNRHLTGSGIRPGFDGAKALPTPAGSRYNHCHASEDSYRIASAISDVLTNFDADIGARVRPAIVTGLHLLR